MTNRQRAERKDDTHKSQSSQNPRIEIMPSPLKAVTSRTRQSSRVPSRELALLGDALEERGVRLYSVALKSRTSRGFRERIRLALSFQKRASTSFRKAGAEAMPRYLRVQAMEAFLGYWFSNTPSTKKQFLDKSWSLAQESLRAFEKSKQFENYAETFYRFSPCVALSVEYDESFRSRLRKLRTAVEVGRKTLRLAKSSRNNEQSAKAGVRLSLFLDGLADDIPDPAKRQEYERESLQLWEESIRISRRTSMLESSHPLSGFRKSPDPSLNQALCQEALRIVKPKHDNFAIGRLTENLSKWTYYAARSPELGEDAARAKELLLKALHYAEVAAQHYDIINHTSPMGGVLWVHSPYADHFQELARYENDLTNRRLLLEKAIQSTPELLQEAKKRGSPLVMFYALFITMKTETLLAETEQNRAAKKRLLRDALAHSIQAQQMVDRVAPVNSWNRGITLQGVAKAYSKLAEFEELPDRRKELLLSSMRNYQACLKFTTSFVSRLEVPEHNVLSVQIGLFHREYGDIVRQLSDLTRNDEYLRKAAKEYSTAAEWFARIPRFDRLAECHWKSGEVYDRLQFYSLASESFKLASKAYIELGTRVPALKQLSEDYAGYLMSWAAIELARTYHNRNQYGQASEEYRSAAKLLVSAKRWRFLNRYFAAWSKLESGEEESKQGHRGRAIKAFHRAAELFSESREILQRQLPSLDQPDEKAMTIKLAKSHRTEYAQARMTIEEAMGSESREDYEVSYEKFKIAAEKLWEISRHSESERERNEAIFLSTLCEAWQVISKAQNENSTRLLSEAGILFEKAIDIAPNQNSAKLAHGHAAFCRGLKAGRQFAETLDATFCKEASAQMELAASLYLESGFKAASEHSVARKFLLEALAQMQEANNEEDREKQATGYQMASIMLVESAKAFQKAHQPKEKERVLALSEKVRAESRVASKLIGILRGTLNPSTNVAFTRAAHGDERAAGLHRFECGDVEIHLVEGGNEAGTRNSVEVKVEITNTGGEPIRLLKLENIVPEGAQMKEFPEKWRIEGRSLSPPPTQMRILQTETVKITIQASEMGLLRISPKAIFVDGSGVLSERNVEPRIVTLSPIMDFLAKAFVEDLASKRLAWPISGWRTLNEIVHVLRVPKSHLYGEPRYGRTFGRQLDSLVKASLVEYRIFPGERGRGGDITKVRVFPDNEDVRAFIEQSAPIPMDLSRVQRSEFDRPWKAEVSKVSAGASGLGHCRKVSDQ